MPERREIAVDRMRVSLPLGFHLGLNGPQLIGKDLRQRHSA